MKLFSGKKGFTLIELLVVITLIAILAVAVLAAINPIEQRNKAADVGVQTAGSETIAAFERFFSTYGCFPDNTTTMTPVTCPATLAVARSVDPATLANFTNLVTAGEIKSTDLQKRLQANTSTNIYIDGNNQVHVCYIPASKAYKGKASFSNIAVSGGAVTTHVCLPDTKM